MRFSHSASLFLNILFLIMLDVNNIGVVLLDCGIKNSTLLFTF